MLNLLFHSSEAIVGGSPYNRTAGRAGWPSSTGSTPSSVMRPANLARRLRRSASSGRASSSPTLPHRPTAPPPQSVMRICHVSPHLPPDQAANALLPAELGRRMAARGDEVAFVAHEPGQGGPPARPHADPASAGGTLPPGSAVRWIPRRRSAGVLRSSKIDAWLVVRRVNAALNGVARACRSAAPAQQRPDHRSRGRVGAPAPHSVRAHALRHRDLALQEAAPDRSIHGRLSRRSAGHLLQPAPAWSAPGAKGSIATACRWSIRRSTEAFGPRDDADAAGPAAASGHRRAARDSERETAAPARRPALSSVGLCRVCANPGAISGW